MQGIFKGRALRRKEDGSVVEKYTELSDQLLPGPGVVLQHESDHTTHLCWSFVTDVSEARGGVTSPRQKEHESGKGTVGSSCCVFPP